MPSACSARHPRPPSIFLLRLRNTFAAPAERRYPCSLPRDIALKMAHPRGAYRTANFNGNITHACTALDRRDLHIALRCLHSAAGFANPRFPACPLVPGSQPESSSRSSPSLEMSSRPWPRSPMFDLERGLPSTLPSPARGGLSEPRGRASRRFPATRPPIFESAARKSAAASPARSDAYRFCGVGVAGAGEEQRERERERERALTGTNECECRACEIRSSQKSSLPSSPPPSLGGETKLPARTVSPLRPSYAPPRSLPGGVFFFRWLLPFTWSGYTRRPTGRGPLSARYRRGISAKVLECSL